VEFRSGPLNRGATKIALRKWSATNSRLPSIAMDPGSGRILRIVFGEVPVSGKLKHLGAFRIGAQHESAALRQVEVPFASSAMRGGADGKSKTGCRSRSDRQEAYPAGINFPVGCTPIPLRFAP